MRQFLILICLLPLSLGCGQSPQLGQVSGALTIDGEPGHKVLIEFMPAAGIDGPTSSAETDSAGRYDLELNNRSEHQQFGAMVGSHVVVLSDLQLAESPTGEGIPIRFGDDYTMPTTTPLNFKVSEGEQTINIEIP